jgi:hypothetical protein
MGVRRLIAFIKGLPVDSASVRKHQGDMAGWSIDTELNAATVDVLQALLNVTLAAHGGKPSEVKPVPRPYKIEKEPDKTVGLAEFADFLKG